MGTLAWMDRKRAHRLVEHLVDLTPLALALVGVALILFFFA